MEIWWILNPWQCTYNANLWSTYKWLVHSLKRMWLVMSIVNARPFYKRMSQDVKKIIMGWIYATTHLYGRFEKKNDIYQNSPLREVWEEINIIWRKWLIVLYVYMSLCELWKGKKKEIVLAYKGCGHYWVPIQICHLVVYLWYNKSKAWKTSCS